ncbi:uncharacterized protein PAC_02090 [Phialocephala subalpina]|uniref:Uncharacterized protein n=1 Tax=Phialocephala subalpina TaxID=576137 RepID=A0A1L7WHG6_9HELO|nr:uncharacterized protein PAC_02090 [Phialocephala subalpina]
MKFDHLTTVLTLFNVGVTMAASTSSTPSLTTSSHVTSTSSGVSTVHASASPSSSVFSLQIIPSVTTTPRVIASFNIDGGQETPGDVYSEEAITTTLSAYWSNSQTTITKLYTISYVSHSQMTILTTTVTSSAAAPTRGVGMGGLLGIGVAALL